MEDLEYIDAHIFDLFARFPFECEVTGQAYEGRNENIEYLLPGGRLRLQSDWNNPYFAHVGIKVYDTAGRRLANVGGYLNPSDDDRAAIACLLPHIKATAINVSPLGTTLNSRRRLGQFEVHLEIEPIDISMVSDEVHQLLAQSSDGRARHSIV